MKKSDTISTEIHEDQQEIENYSEEIPHKGFWLSNLSLKKSTSVFIIMLLIIIVGAISYNALPREAFPEVQIPYLIVTIPYPGSSPTDVEFLIVNKMETEMQNLDGLKEISSTASEGAGMVALEYDLGFDIEDAKTDVREALDRVKPKLPDDAEEPIITEINTADFPIMIINISGNQGLFRLKEIAELLKERIEKIPGILEVKRAGGLEREVQVSVNPNKLDYYNIDLNEVSNAIAYENASIPAGDITMGPLKYMVRVPGEIISPDEINNMIITAPNQIPVYTSDVAVTKFGFKEVTSKSRLHKVESVSLSVSKRSGENLIEITKDIKQLIEEEKTKHGKNVTFTVLSDHSDFVKTLIRDLENNLYTGLIAVLMVLLFFLGTRTSLFVAAAIPFSMLISFIIIQALGLTLNMVVLMALIMALGMLVDNAIVIVENIYRHLELGLSPKEAARTGVGEVAVPVITSTLTTLAAFFPLLFMPGIMGDFMSYMPKTLIITLSASLFVGLIINPVLCGSIMRPAKTLKTNDPIQIAESIKFLGIYRNALTWSLNHRAQVILFVGALWILIIIAYARLIAPVAGSEFFPTSEPENAIIHIEAPPGTTLEQSNKMVENVEEILIPYYEQTKSIVANVGQARGSMSRSGKTTHLNHIVTTFPTWEGREELPTTIIKQIRKVIASFSGAKYKITKDAHGPPTGKPVNIEIRGKDMIVLKRISLDIQEKIKDTEGLVNLDDNFRSNRSEIQVIIDREKAARLGLRTMQVASILRTAFNGKTVSTYRDGKEEYDIIVRLDKQHRASISNLQSLHIKTPYGQSVSLSELAEVKNAKAFGSIRHIGTDRVVTVSGDAEEVAGAEILKSVQKKLENYKLPSSEYSLTYSGENTSQKEMSDYLPKAFLIAVFLMYLILVSQFDSLALPMVIISSILLSLMGVFLGMIIHRSPFSIVMGGIGIISLAGVVVNNAIVLIDYIKQLREKGLPRKEAIILGGMLRLRPVLLTAMTTILALLPMTVGMDVRFSRSPILLFGSESGQMWVPMAQSMIYGLSVATVLTLIIVPVLYSLVESGRDRFRLFSKTVSNSISGVLEHTNYNGSKGAQ